MFGNHNSFDIHTFLLDIESITRKVLWLLILALDTIPDLDPTLLKWNPYP